MESKVKLKQTSSRGRLNVGKKACDTRGKAVLSWAKVAQKMGREYKLSECGVKLKKSRIKCRIISVKSPIKANAW